MPQKKKKIHLSWIHIEVEMKPICMADAVSLKFAMHVII